MQDTPADRLEALIAGSGITAHEAAIDPLTGLIAGPAARRLLEFRLGQQPGVGRAHAVTMIDVNGLREANTSGGHAAGDHLLAQVGLVLRTNVRDGDAFRLGGDEFVVVHQVRCLHADNDADAIESRLRDMLGSWAAVGTARWVRDGETTLGAADHRMYTHKAQQRFDAAEASAVRS